MCPPYLFIICTFIVIVDTDIALDYRNERISLLHSSKVLNTLIEIKKFNFTAPHFFSAWSNPVLLKTF